MLAGLGIEETCCDHPDNVLALLGMVEMLREFFDSRGETLAVDRESGIIRGVKILGLESRNGRSYAPSGVAKAVGLYEGAKVNVNHPAGSPVGPRRYEDRIGVLRNVKADESGLRGDFHFNPKHALAEQLLWDAAHAPENVGFSHNVEAKCGRKGGSVVVEEITRVQSVDLVADPATTRGLFEGTQTKEPTVEYTSITEEELRANRPDLCKYIADKALTEHADSEAEKAKDATIKALTEQVEALTEEKRIADLAKTIDRELTEAKLPAAAVTEVFRGQLLAADADTRKVLIEDRRKVATAGRVVCREQFSDASADLPKDSETFARALKG